MIDSPWKRAAMCIAVGLLVFAAFSSQARADLMGYWNFDDAANSAVATDASGGGNDGTISGAIYSADGGGHTGLAGDYALNFGTVNNGARVYLPSAGSGGFSSMTDNNEATVSIWILGDASQPVNDTAFGFYNGADTRQFQAHIPWSNQNIYFDVGGCCGASQRINAPESDSTKWEGQWNHYAFVKDASGSRIYQNGALWLSGATTAPIGQIIAAYIGSEVNATNSYAGLIDDYAVWDEALSDTEIAGLASGAASPADWATPPAQGFAINVAPVYGTATQSSTRSGGGGNAAFFAIDGDANGTFNDGSVTHTNDEPDTWWQVDLGTTFPVEMIQLFNRADSCCVGRLSNFRLSVLDDSMSEVFGQDVSGAVDRFFGQAFNVPEGTEGRFVRIQLNGLNNDGSGIVSLAEVRVVSRLDKLPNAINVAQEFGLATQSSTRVGTGGNDANFAIDGDTDGQWGNDSVTHTNDQPDSWWQVDLGRSMQLENIRLYGRRDCCGGRLGNFRLSVLDEGGNEVYGEDVSGTVPAGGQNFALPFGIAGSTVRVQLNGLNNEGNGVLQLAEAQVIGGPLANLARNPLAEATQSSTRVGSGGNEARFATDGNTDGVFTDGSVTHTLDEPDTWWQVDLGKPAMLDEIILYNRSDCCGDRLSNFHLSVLSGASEVFGEDFFTAPGTSVPQGGSFRIPLPDMTIGDTIRLQLLGTNNAGNGTLSLAEVQAFGFFVPEPSSIVLFGLGAVALFGLARRRRKR